MFEKNKDNIDNNETDIMAVLSKLIELEKEKQKVGPIKITICVTSGIAALIFVGLLCYRMVNTDFSLDSVLSMLLAFFSIFISIFFYFKADETSTNFYKSSYDIMKDVSITLGKIEERFGEKLNNLNDKISHLDNMSSENSEELQKKLSDKNEIVNDLMDKAKLGQEEKTKIKQQLEEKEKQIEDLKQQQLFVQNAAEIMRQKMIDSGIYIDRWEPNNDLLFSLLEGRKSLSKSNIQRLRRLGYIDNDENINKEKVIATLVKRKMNNEI